MKDNSNRPGLFYQIKNINPSVLLFIAAIIAIILANSSWQYGYFKFLDAPVNLQIGTYSLFQHHGKPMTMLQFVNDALMSLFFFIIGLEIKREIMVGELSSFRKALPPIIAAIGGMILPVLIFTIFANDPDSIHGAAIPMATDIAFALAVISLLGSKVPTSLKVFLTTLAVVDDIGGILVIAIFYSAGINWIPLLLGFLLLALSYILGSRGVNKDYIFYIIGFFVWTFFLESGVHTTISGVLLAMTIPAKGTIKLPELMQHVDHFSNTFKPVYEKEDGNIGFVSHDQVITLGKMEKRYERSIPLVQRMEHYLSPLVNYIILPLFAFVNSGITFEGIDLASLAVIPAGIFFGLVIGKSVGIFGFTWLSSKIKLISLPKGMTYLNLFGVSFFGGIGFTVSLFIASLSYTNLPNGEVLLNQAKMGVLAGTVVSGILGFFILRAILRKEKKAGILPVD